MSAFSHITFAAKSDIGRKRKNNEDSFGAFPALGIYCVADGMGGGDDGEVASAATVSAVENFVNNHPLPQNSAFPAESVIAGVRAAVNGASKWIFERAKNRNLKGCGSTFVGVCLDPARPDQATALHAGDSRLYRIRGRGIQPSVEVEATPLPLKEGDAILICSDGLCRMVPDKKMASIVKDSASPDAAVDSLIAAANEAGGIDNVTVVLVRVGKLPAPLPTVEMPMASDGSDAPTMVTSDSSFAPRDSETGTSFEIATEEGEADAASFATETSTSATLTGLTEDSGAGKTPTDQRLMGTGWKAMQDVSAGEPRRRRSAGKIAVVVAVAVAAVVAALVVAMSGGSGKSSSGAQQPPEASADAAVEKAAREAAAAKAVEDARRQAEEEARKKVEAEMAARLAEMQRKIKEAEDQAAQAKAAHDAETRELEERRKAEEEARRKAEEAEKAERAEREAEAKRLEEEKRKLERRQRQLEEERMAAEKAREKAEAERLKAEEQAKKSAEEARKKAEEEAARRKALEEKARKDAKIREKAWPHLQGAWEYCDAGEARMALVELRAANDIGYVLTKQEYERIRRVYDSTYNELGRRIRNKKLASDREREKFMREQEDLGELWSGIKSELAVER